MSRHLARIRKDKTIRRCVPVGASQLVIWLRVRDQRGGGVVSEIAIAPKGSHRTRLRWRSVADVLIESFSKPASSIRQRSFAEVIREP